MIYVAVSRDNKRTPIEQASPTGAPLFSLPIDGLQSGAPVAITAAERGHPLASLRDLPAGDYWMQPFVNIYTRFARADGKTVWLHMDQWEGQNWKQSPGNIYGEPVRYHSIRGPRHRFAWSRTRSFRRSRRRRIPNS